jgi:uncharacterized protein DUF397
MKIDTNYVWRKSTYSATESECVELAVGPEGGAVRDTKDRAGGHLWFTRAAFAAFLVAATETQLSDQLS